MKVGLFVSCLADMFEPRAAEAVVRVLEHLGCEIVVPRGQTCCGQPLSNDGYTRQARRLMVRLARRFRGCERVVTPSGSCCAFVRRHGAALTPDDADVSALATAVRTFPELLLDDLGVDLAALGCRWPAAAVVHRGCHLREAQPVDRAGEVIAQVAGLQPRPWANSEQCCGFGGTFAVQFPEVSGALLADRVSGARASGADWVICSDPGCGLQLRGGAHAAGLDVAFKHVAEVVAEGLGLLPRAPRVRR